MARFPFHKQLDSSDCGAACLRMIAAFYGKRLSSHTIGIRTYTVQQGTSMLSLKHAAESFGFEAQAIRTDWQALRSHVDLPCIVHWNKNHFVVVYRIEDDKVYIADPAYGRIKCGQRDFYRHWYVSEKEVSGFVLLLRPGKEFIPDEDRGERLGFLDFAGYLKPYRAGIAQLLLTMTVASIISLVFPLLTQAVVDRGIGQRNLGLIALLLVAQLLLTLGQAANDLIRSWLMLHITNRVSISFIADFLYKLVRLPISFFDTKRVGDIIQRISDNSRIQNFLTGTLISMLIAAITFIVYAAVMAGYNPGILGVFLLGSAVYVVWVTFFLRKRRELDRKRFEESASNHSNLVQLVSGMQEIKLNGTEKKKLWEWERIQTRLYKVGINSMALEQTQSIGGIFIDQVKNILISYMSARLVVEGAMTLGMMMAVQYIIGQLNAPISQFISFIGSTQDAKLSLERLGEIYSREDEESEEHPKNASIPDSGHIVFDDVVFQYEGPDSERVLDGVSFELGSGKVTAIVGVSGSGKTTLLKLLLGFYKPVSGQITLAGEDLASYSDSAWRSRCGVVMQEGFVFSDTIRNNIAVGTDRVDEERLKNAAHVANVDGFIESLPMGYDTVIGTEGSGVSSGQKQRILIARAVYKNPAYIFLDEATNALDTTNENVILSNLEEFFRGRTVMIIAHRLSTVKNADRIIVLDKGRVAESGTHAQLLAKKGLYYGLVKDQIELNRTEI